MLVLLGLVFVFSVSSFAGDNLSVLGETFASGPIGGDMRQIVIDPKNGNTLFVTTLDGQVYKSQDGGISWTFLIKFKPQGIVLDDLIMDSRDSNILYVAGHRHLRAGGFFKTIDGGKTWKESKSLSNSAIHAVTQSLRDPNLILVGTVKGIWVSRDSGETFSKYSSPSVPTKLDSLAIDPVDIDTMYAGTWWRPYKSTDGGKSWRLVKKGLYDDSDIFAIDISLRNPDVVIVSACSGIYQSNDKGENWKKISRSIPGTSRRTRAIVRNPHRPHEIYAGTTQGLWRSTNDGASWKLQSSKNLEINSIAVHPTDPNRIFLATNNYGLMVSSNSGVSFVAHNGNFSSRFAYDIVPDIERPNRFYSLTVNTSTGGGFLFISNDFGRTWTSSKGNFETSKTTAFSLVQDKVNTNTLYAASNFGIHKSVNRGVTWRKLVAPKIRRARTRRGRAAQAAAQAAAKSKGFVSALSGKVNRLLSTSDGKNGFFAATNSGLYRSYDIVKGWQKLDLGVGVSEQVFALHVVPGLPETIWAGTSSSGLMVSRDGGSTWIRSGNQMIQNRVPISAITTNPENPNVVYVGTVQSLYLSKDGGATWVRRGGKLPIGNYNSILINPKRTNEIFVASAMDSSPGIYHSTDAGWTWERIDTSVSMASRRVWGLIFNPSDQNELMAATHSSGVYRITRNPTITAKVESDQVATPKVTATSENITRLRVSGGN